MYKKALTNIIISGAIAVCLFGLSSEAAIFAKKEPIKKTEPVSEKTVIKGGVALSIDDCIKIAIENDPNVSIARDLEKISKTQVRQAQSDYFPSLTAGNSFNFQNTQSQSGMMSNMGTMTSGTNTNITYYQLNLGVNQLIWNFGKTDAKINMQKYTNEARKYDLEDAILQAIYRVKTAYFTVLAAKANLDIYERSVKINKLNYERTKALFEEGLKSKIDVVNAGVYLTDAKIQLLTAKNEYQTAMIALNKSMYYTHAPEYDIKNTESFNFRHNAAKSGEVNVAYVKTDYKTSKDAENSAILTSGIEKNDILMNYKFAPYSISPDDAVDKAYENRPDLKSLLLVERAQVASLKAIKLMYMPDLAVNAGYNFRKSSETQNSGFTAGASLNLPTVNVMSIKYKIDEGKSYLDMAKNNVDLSRKNIYFEVNTYYVSMQELERRIPLLAEKIQQTLENFELADGRYTVGLGNFIELQDAQLNYNNAQLAYVQAVFRYNLAKTLLEKSMGVM